MRVSLLIFLIVFLFDVRAEEARAWRIDYGNPKDIVDVLASTNLRHPGFLRSQVRYRADLSRLFERAARFVRHLPKVMSRAPEVSPFPIRRLEIAGGPERMHDSEQVEKLRLDLRERLRKVGERRTNLTEDLARADDPRALLEVAPLLYDENGHATAPLEVSSAPPGVLESLYFDLWPEHLLPLVSDSRFAALAREVQAQFVEAFMRPALTQSETGALTDSVVVYLEEVPKPFALLRGGIGFDCSMSTVPLYVLLDSVRVFWIRKSANPKEHPRGYVLLAEIDLDGRKVPYVITVNGATLSAREGRAAVLLATADYEGNQILTPVEATENVVNREEMRDAIYQNSGRGRSVEVGMPAGWADIDSNSDPYYRAERLKHAKLVTLNDEEKTARLTVAATGRQGFYARTEAARLKHLDRALLYADIVQRENSDPGLRDTFELSDSKIDLVYRLREIGDKDPYAWWDVSPVARLSADEMQTGAREFGLRAVDVFRTWSPHKAAEQLAILTSAELADWFSPEELNGLIVNLRRRLLDELTQAPDQGTDVRAYLLYKLPSTGPEDHFVKDLSGPRRGHSPMAAVLDRSRRVIVRPDTYLHHLIEFNPDQPVWMRLMAVEAWKEAHEKESGPWYRQFEVFARDPDARVRKAAFSGARFHASEKRVYFRALALGARDEDPSVRQVAAEALPSIESVYPNWFWPAIEAWSIDAAPETRNAVAEALYHQKVWPASVWRRFPDLVRDRATRFDALTGVSGKVWPRELWATIVELLREIDLGDYFFGKVQQALWSQDKWTRETVEAMRAFREAHPERLQKLGGHYEPDRVAALVRERARDAFPESEAPTITEDTCAQVLRAKPDPWLHWPLGKLIAGIEKVADFYAKARSR